MAKQRTAGAPLTRREELLEATVEYLLEHGVAGLSLRPLAAAIGTKARLLIYHFGSRDELISAALSLALRRVQNAFISMLSEATLERTLLGFWRWATDPPNTPYGISSSKSTRSPCTSPSVTPNTSAGRS